jgi:hypothetical protein
MELCWRRPGDRGRYEEKMKAIKIILLNIVFPFVVLSIAYAIFEKDKFMNGITAINWVLLSQLLCLIVASYLMWISFLSWKKIILNNKKDIEYKKLIEDTPPFLRSCPFSLLT